MPEPCAPAASERLLGLAYGVAVPPASLAAMERAGKRLGLPLATLERLGEDRARCEGFVRAAAAGEGHAFVRSLDAAPHAPPAAEVRAAVHV